jgi:hypothetical protein
LLPQSFSRHKKTAAFSQNFTKNHKIVFTVLPDAKMSLLPFSLRKRQKQMKKQQSNLVTFFLQTFLPKQGQTTL